MAPLDSGPNAHDDSTSQRPKNRIEFCQSVAERARTIAGKLISNEVWVKKFRDDAESKVHSELESKEDSNPLNGLRAAAKKNPPIDNLQQAKFKSKYDPFLVIVFDEASSLMGETASGKPHPGLYVALNRIISCLKGYLSSVVFLLIYGILDRTVCTTRQCQTDWRLPSGLVCPSCSGRDRASTEALSSLCGSPT